MRPDVTSVVIAGIQSANKKAYLNCFLHLKKATLGSPF